MADALHTLERRYGPLDEVPLDRLKLKAARNRQRRRLIDEQIAELTTERDRLAAEDERIELSRQALVDDLAERIRLRHGEGWSPTPVVGYRLWGIDDGTVVGATGHVWSRPSMEATCRHARWDDDLPHTDHVCSDFGHGCGIYAALSPESFDSGSGSLWIMGVVLLSGKVVEHELGYRAQRAEVAAAVATGTDRWLATARTDVLHRLFADPVGTVAEQGEADDPPQGPALMYQIEQLERSRQSWRLEANSG